MAVFSTTADNIYALQAIAGAYNGILKIATRLTTQMQYRPIFGQSVWLCPDARTKRQLDAECLALTARELFYLTSCMVEVGDDVAPCLLECYRAFDGSVILDELPIKFNDPGIDLSPDDTRRWMRLLVMARYIDADLASRLLYIRGTGCRLTPHPLMGYKLSPIVDSAGKGGWESLEQYANEKSCLNPYRIKLVNLLRILAKWGGCN